MSATPDSAARLTFMVVGIIRADANLAEFAALRDDERERLETLRSGGEGGGHYGSPLRPPAPEDNVHRVYRRRREASRGDAGTPAVRPLLRRRGLSDLAAGRGGGRPSGPVEQGAAHPGMMTSSQLAHRADGPCPQTRPQLIHASSPYIPR